MSKLLSNKVKKISQNPGVYIFKDSSGRILYIGKATNLRSRVGSYFHGIKRSDRQPQLTAVGPLNNSRPIEAVIEKVAKIETRETDSVLEALILESNLIKKYQPPFNVDLKDDKSFSYVVITEEDFPRVLMVRETELEKSKKLKTKNYKPQTIFGPYTSKKQLETALKIIRKIFPYHCRKEKSEKGCLNYQIGLCPGPYASAISKADYKKNIRGIRMILSGKKQGLLRTLKKEMATHSKKQEFEKASEIRNRIFALEHIRDVALILRDEKLEIRNPKSETNLKPQTINYKLQTTRIEAYDISNISGQFAVGSMVVFENREPNKKEYRKFRIKTVEGVNDVAMMAEVLFRRFRNNWRKPDLILLDGGKGHLSMAEKVLKELDVDIPLVAVAKGPSRKISNFKFLMSKKFPVAKFQDELSGDRDCIGQIMGEAHRFAIKYHKKVRRGEFIEK